MSLSSRILRQVMLVAGGASLLFGMLFLGLYRDQLERERAATSEQINRLLRVALENAMLKRDVPGLREIVRQMGEQPGIAGVMILSPEGEVRFASAAEKMGQQLPQLAASGQPGVPVTRFVHEAGQGEILRSINPVPNQAPCVACHGPLAKHPINGILVVDYDAGTIREQAYRSAALFTAAGIAVLALTLWSIWRLLRRRVIDPLANLDIAANALAAGNLTQRAEVVDADEPGRLATSFNRMAERLVDQIQQGEVQQRYLQELLDGLPDGVRVIRKADYRILTVNAAYCSQLNVEREAVIGRLCYQSSHGRQAPCAATMVICPISELQSPGQSVKCRHRHLVSDGRELPVEVHAVLLVRESEQGREELIVESISDLSHVVRHSQEQRLSELGLLAAGIAHEIHNPLGSMRLAVDGLLRWVRQEQGDRQRLTDYLEMMNAEIDRCTGITQRLLMLSRLPQQQPQIVVLNRAVADTVALLEFDAMSHHIEQRLDLESQELRVLADDSDLRMLVLNLVQNAHHAMPQGGIVTVRTRLAGDKAQIEIVDTGCGIPEDALARIFDPFFSRRADGEGGTGLGLTICQSIVERYGGKIEVASVLAQGTTFRITLPRAVE